MLCEVTNLNQQCEVSHQSKSKLLANVSNAKCKRNGPSPRGHRGLVLPSEPVAYYETGATKRRDESRRFNAIKAALSCRVRGASPSDAS